MTGLKPSHRHLQAGQGRPESKEGLPGRWDLWDAHNYERQQTSRNDFFANFWNAALTRLPLVSPCGDLSQRKVDYWRSNEVKNLKKSKSIYCRIICLFILFIEIQPLYCFRGKMCRTLEKWDPLMGSLSSKRSQTSKFYIYRPCFLDMRSTLAPHLLQGSAADQLERAEYSRTTFRRKTVGGGRGVCITLSPYYQ
jgi:hypothetical protein